MKKIIALLVMSILLASCGQSVEQTTEIEDNQNTTTIVEQDTIEDKTTEEEVDEIVEEVLSEEEINATLEEFFNSLDEME